MQILCDFVARQIYVDPSTIVKKSLSAIHAPVTLSEIPLLSRSCAGLPEAWFRMFTRHYRRHTPRKTRLPYNTKKPQQRSALCCGKTASTNDEQDFFMLQKNHCQERLNRLTKTKTGKSMNCPPDRLCGNTMTDTKGKAGGMGKWHVNIISCIDY